MGEGQGFEIIETILNIKIRNKIHTIKNLIILTLLSLSPFLVISQSKTCTIREKVSNPSSTYLVLIKATDRMGLSKDEKITLDSNGTFNHQFAFEHFEAYHLIYGQQYEEWAYANCILSCPR